METEEFKRVAEDLFGNGWQSRMARALGVDGSTVRRWVGGTIPVPPQIVAYLDVLADRQRTRGALILERQPLGAPELVVVPEPAVLEWMEKRFVFEGVDQPKPMPAIHASEDDTRILLSMDGAGRDGISLRTLSFVLTRHPDSQHLSGYLAAASAKGHSAAVVRHKIHHYTVIAHRIDGDPTVIHQIATHAGQVRTLWSTTDDPTRITESHLV